MSKESLAKTMEENHRLVEERDLLRKCAGYIADNDALRAVLGELVAQFDLKDNGNYGTAVLTVPNNGYCYGVVADALREKLIEARKLLETDK